MSLLQRLMQQGLLVLMQVIIIPEEQESFDICRQKKKVILACKISQKTDHEIKHAKALIRQSNNTRKSECYVMDKGYDSEKIHSLIREKIKAGSIIPLRVRKRKKIGGKYRKQLHLSFDKTKYNQRNIAENTFSVVKRKFGETLRARKLRNQV